MQVINSCFFVPSHTCACPGTLLERVFFGVFHQPKAMRTIINTMHVVCAKCCTTETHYNKAHTGGNAINKIVIVLSHYSQRHEQNRHNTNCEIDNAHIFCYVELHSLFPASRFQAFFRLCMLFPRTQ